MHHHYMALYTSYLIPLPTHSPNIFDQNLPLLCGNSAQIFQGLNLHLFNLRLILYLDQNNMSENCILICYT